MQSILLDIVHLWRSLAKNVQTDHEWFLFIKVVLGVSHPFRCMKKVFILHVDPLTMP